LSNCAFGQGVGTIHGTVTDASGKAVPRAKVTAVLEGRGTTRTIDTDEQGSYVFPSMPVGLYALRIEAAGFKTSARSGVELSTN
jgi:protocatechuate 3,4-dioxygenase beta subunit